jgi:hypothetical protein
MPKIPDPIDIHDDAASPLHISTNAGLDIDELNDPKGRRQRFDHP